MIMKCIGLIGGTGWLSSAEYYRLLNEEYARRLGGLSSAHLVMVSLEFAEVRAYADAGDRAALVGIFVDAAERLKRAGADMVALCSNSAHGLIESLEASVDLPFVHIADAIAAEIHRNGWKRLGLLGTRETMEMPFMKDRLTALGVDVSVPDADDRAWLHEMIFSKLEQGRAGDAEKRAVLKLVEKFKEQGADAVILGCTELPLLLPEGSGCLPLLDSTRIHAHALAALALN